jgi:hypothetical protein
MQFNPPFFIKPNCISTIELRINWDGELSGNAENPDNWIFLGKLATLTI